MASSGDSDDPRAWLELVGELGRGGAGTVYRGRDRRTGRELAVKLLNVPRPTAQQRERFVREGQIAAGLRHPGIVAVHAAGELDGRPFLAFELVPGARPLDAVAQGLPLAERARLVRDAARALGHAHRQGVVHRDVKPGNLLVDAEGRVRVADFGVAAARSLERITVSGTVVGTPDYMAPEQISSHEARYAPTADVWSLGVVLYQALTGELPFEGRGLVELAGAICGGRFSPPRALDPTIPPALEQVCLRALAAAPSARWADGEAFAHGLDEALAARAPERRGGSWLLLAAVLAGAAALTAVAALLVPLDGPARPAATAAGPARGPGSGSLATTPSDTTTALARSPLPPLGPPPPAKVRNPIVDELRDAALRGDGESMWRLSQFLRRGDLGKDREEGQYWLERAARAGQAEGMRDLAEDLERRQPVDRQRVHELLLAAGETDGLAAWRLSARYGDGRTPAGVADAAEAERWLRRAVELGSDDAHTAMARRLLEAGDLARAAEHLRAAARGKDTEGTLLLARLLIEGKLDAHPAAEAETLLGALIEDRDTDPPNRRAAEDLLELILAPRDPPELQFLHGHAAGGEPAAMTELGRSFRRGTLVRADPRRARFWFRRAAEAGDPSAMSLYADTLLEGIPGTADPDPGAAVPWLTRAADLGDRAAAVQLVNLYAQGRPLSDPARHRAWLERGVRLGSSDCAHGLAVLLLEEGEAAQAVALLRQYGDDPSCALLLAELLVGGRAPGAGPDEAERLLEVVLGSSASGPGQLERARALRAKLRAGRD